MKQKFVKSLIVMVLALSVVCCSVISASALPINNVTNSYFYNVDGFDAAAPLAFTVERTISIMDLVPGTTASSSFSPADLHYSNGLLYVLDSAENRVLVLDEQYQVVSTIRTLTGEIPDLAIVEASSEEEEGVEGEGGEEGNKGTSGSNKFQLSSPQGIFVTDEGLIYISDTNNQRIVVCDITGKVSKVYQSIKVAVLGEKYAFQPTRLVVDNTGDLQIICAGINRGIMQVNSDGEFRAFFGAPDVTVSLWERVWREFATEQQLAQMVTHSPTEYSSVAIDDRGFVYPTIAALDETSVKSLKTLAIDPAHAPIKKLSADGTDMLRRKGLSSPMGDLIWAPGRDTYPKIVDISVDSDSGRYTVLDRETGRFFTYDTDGNLLYLCGGLGSAEGTFQMPAAIEANGDFIYVSDTTAKTITVFRATAYVRAINAAAEASANGYWEESIPLWKEVLSYNSSMYIANIGLGKAEMRLAMDLIDDRTDKNGMNALDHYEQAIVYFDRANEKDSYSIAFTALRTNELEDYFGLIFGAIGVLIVGLFVFSFVRKQIKKKKSKPVFRSSDKEGPKINRAKKKGDEE